MPRQLLVRGVHAVLHGRSLRWNFLGNVGGRLWQGLLNLAVVPLYIHLLGAEAFGVVGLVQSLQIVLLALDFGLPTTVNREVAMLCEPGRQKQAADAVRTFECIYWVVAGGIFVLIAAVAGWIARVWVVRQSLSALEVQTAVIAGGAMLASRWPAGLYTGVLRGLERQLLLNAIVIAAFTARCILTVVALLLLSRTVVCFLLVQALVCLTEVLLLSAVSWRLADPQRLGRFRLETLRRLWRFALGINLTGTMATLAAGADKLLIGKLLPLGALACYSVCGTAVGALLLIQQSAAYSLFPRFSRHAGRGECAELARLYWLSLRMMFYLCLGPVMVLCFFSREVLWLWTRSMEMAGGGSALCLLAAAALCQCVASSSLYVLIATGHTRASVALNAICLPLIWIGCWWAIRQHGLAGAATCYLTYQAVCALVYGECCRRRALGIGRAAFIRQLPGTLLLLAVAIGFTARYLLPANASAILTLFGLSAPLLAFYPLGILLLGGEERRMILAPLRFLRGRAVGRFTAAGEHEGTEIIQAV